MLGDFTLISGGGMNVLSFSVFVCFLGGDCFYRLPEIVPVKMIFLM